MASLGFTFDPSTVQAERSFDPIPAGDYLAIIMDSDVVATKAGDGTILKLTFQVVDGPMQGRLVFDNLNIENRNPAATEIAQSRLGSICKSIGLSGPLQDSAVLHNQPLMIRVDVKNDPQYGAKNRIKSVAAAPGVVHQQPAMNAPFARPAAASQAAPNWAKRPQ
jgi:hypothetical protein